jgi:hypothetical protein
MYALDRLAPDPYDGSLQARCATTVANVPIPQTCLTDNMAPY